MSNYGVVILLLCCATTASAQLKIATGSASAAADAVVDRIDAGSGPGTLVIFGSACPDAANDADAGTTLAILTFSDPAFGAASNGTATANAITADSSANATGTAMCFRAKDSDANVVFQGTITTAGNGGDIILSATSITAGQSVAISALTYTQPTNTDLIAAASCSAADVQTAIDSAEAGDTVFIPAGTCNWTTGVTWAAAPANTRLIGAGSAVLGGGDATIIVDNYASTSPLLGIVTDVSGSFRLAGLTIRGGTGSIKENGLLAIGGRSKQLRVDHLHIDMQTYTTLTSAKTITFSMDIAGVVDNLLIDLAKQGQMHFSAGKYGTGVENHGDASYAAATGFGTSDFVFIESSQFNGEEDPDEPGVFMGTLTDCNAGGRFVMRYNTVYGAGVGQTHPTGGAGRGRGCRALELYGNTVEPGPGFNPMTDSPPFAFSWVSAGTAVIWGNTASGVYKSFLFLDVMRKNNNTYTQIATPNGWGYCGTAFNGTGSNWDGNTVGSTGYPCLDQPGRGQSDLLEGEFPDAVNTDTDTIAWPDQALEPVREWLNTFTAVDGWGNDADLKLSISSGAETRIIENRDVYSTPTSFDGTVGTGSGVRASRPSTCTTGVSYWSTDQGGNWHTANAGANDGTLDVCTATNTWTNAVYTPYTYPHPLR